ncbi:MAG: FecR family protein [Chryseosolibacter sp.]
MDEKEFKRLIERCLSGHATREELTLVEKWLDHRSGKDRFEELSANEKEETRTRILETLSSKMADRPVHTAKAKLNAGARILYRVAAAVLVLAVLTYTLLEFTARNVDEENPATGLVSSGPAGKKTILSDSSIVWLKGNSSILYPEKFDDKDRKVKLKGEALFEVSKSPDRPFIIECGGLTAKVLGTSFNIRSSENDIEVLVLTGKVALYSKGRSDSLIVLPNEKAVYHSAQNRMTKVVVKENEKIAKTAGTQYSMRFNATRMNEIIRRIEEKFDVRVSLTEERLSNCTITADFTDQSLDRTLNMISQSLEIEYEINDHEVTLSGAGCD